MAAAPSDDRFGDVRAAVDRIAAEDAAEVLSEARAEARRLVRALLVNALSEAMIDSLRPTGASSEPAPAAPRRAAPQERAPRPAPERSREQPAGHGLHISCRGPAQ